MSRKDIPEIIPPEKLRELNERIVKKYGFDPRGMYENGILPDIPTLPCVLSRFLNASTTTYQELIDDYAKDSCFSVTIASFKNPHNTITKYMDFRYINTLDEDYRIAVASNYHTPVEVIIKLFSDTSIKVKRAAAVALLNNNNTPKEKLQQAKEFLNSESKIESKTSERTLIDSVKSFVTNKSDPVNKKRSAIEIIYRDDTPVDILLYLLNFLKKNFPSSLAS